uniref:hypothetical protein n=1 Tax=Algoriphagus sp. TaxID=1872435 RepID=UPI00404811AC
MDFRIKKVGDEWEFLPEKERKEKRDYEKLVLNIERKEKKIERMLIELGKEKKSLRDLKKNRTVYFNKMVKYHKKFLPKFSYHLDDEFNPQWGLWVSVGSTRRSVYLGTVSTVSYHLDLLENHVPHYNEKNSFKDIVGYYEKLKPTNKEGNEHFQIIKSKIESYVEDPLKNIMLEILKEDGDLNRFFDTKNFKINGKEILYDLYKISSHYQPPQEERVRKKGGRLHSLNVGKNKKWDF